jgi:hypothetical protein
MRVPDHTTASPSHHTKNSAERVLKPTLPLLKKFRVNHQNTLTLVFRNKQ